MNGWVVRGRPLSSSILDTAQEQAKGGVSLPSYEFKCSACGATGASTFAFSEQAFKICEECDLPMQRVYSVPGLVFKGDGWGGQ